MGEAIDIRSAQEQRAGRRVLVGGGSSEPVVASCAELWGPEDRWAEADMENMTAIILAVAWYWARRDMPTLTSYAVFYAICFLAAQAKGMAAIAVPLIVIVPDLMREKRWRDHVSVSHVLALAMGVLLYLAIERFRPGLMTRIVGSEMALASLVMASTIVVGGYVTWQHQVINSYQTMRSFCTDLKGELADVDTEMASSLQGQRSSRC